MRSNLSLLIVVGVALIGLSACSPPGTNVSYNGDEIVVKDPNGTVTAKAGKTPYPSDLPVPMYPGSEMIVTASDTDAKSSAKSMAMLKSMDATDKIMTFYKDKLTAAGWTIDNSLSGQMSFISAKSGSQSINISIIDGGKDGSTISVGLQ
ncbi:MAG: hypothetical protein K2X77_07940 [Candidatus Obscuribacterales bacterium]|jgi:hypothetical protein|nr:hypothetical protein [Candidatus Obscuribacterales bacterium]